MQNSTVIYICMMNLFSFKIVIKCWLCTCLVMVVLNLVIPQLFQLSVVLATFVWEILKCGTLRLMPVVYWCQKIGFDCSSLQKTWALQRDIFRRCFVFRLSSIFSRVAERLRCCDTLLSPRYPICLFCQHIHDIHLFIHTCIMHTQLYLLMSLNSYTLVVSFSNNVFDPSKQGVNLSIKCVSFLIPQLS